MSGWQVLLLLVYFCSQLWVCMWTVMVRGQGSRSCSGTQHQPPLVSSLSSVVPQRSAHWQFKFQALGSIPSTTGFFHFPVSLPHKNLHLQLTSSWGKILWESVGVRYLEVWLENTNDQKKTAKILCFICKFCPHKSCKVYGMLKQELDILSKRDKLCLLLNIWYSSIARYNYWCLLFDMPPRMKARVLSHCCLGGYWRNTVRWKNLAKNTI